MRGERKISASGKPARRGIPEVRSRDGYRRRISSRPGIAIARTSSTFANSACWTARPEGIMATIRPFPGVSNGIACSSPNPSLEISVSICSAVWELEKRQTLYRAFRESRKARTSVIDVSLPHVGVIGGVTIPQETGDQKAGVHQNSAPFAMEGKSRPRSDFRYGAVLGLAAFHFGGSALSAMRYTARATARSTLAMFS